MEWVTAFRTWSRISGGVIEWTAVKSIVLEFPRYPEGSAPSSLVLNTVPAMDCMLNCEEIAYVIFKTFSPDQLLLP